jgi:hypothetical protein
MVGLILTILSWFVVGRSTAAPAPANTAGTMGPQATDPSQAPVQSATSDGRLTRRRPELRRCEVAMVPGMRESPLDQAKRAYRQDNPKEAVDLTGERFSGRRRQASFWRTPRTVGAEVSQPECTRTMEGGSSRAGRRSGSGHQRRGSGESCDAQGLLVGLAGALHRKLVATPSGRASSTRTRPASAFGRSAVAQRDDLDFRYLRASRRPDWRKT